MSSRVGKTLGRFHHRLALQMKGRQPMWDTTDRCFYPLLYVAMTEVGLEEVEMHILPRQNTVAQYIVTSPILELCIAAKRHMGTQVTQQRWYQDVLNLVQEEGREEELTVELENGGGGETWRWWLWGVG